jgi:hypothetical protein
MTINRNLSILAGGVSSTGVLGVPNGGSGAITLTGYVKGNGISAFTAATTIPTTDLSGTITNAQLANSAITINGTSTSLGGSISVGTVTSVTATAPVASTGGTTPIISMPVATTSVSGYLSSTDWTTFNNKGSGSVTSVGLSAPALFTVTGSPVTGSGTLALSYSGTALPAANGGTGLTSLTSGYIPYGNGTGAFNSSSNLYFDGTKLGIGTSSPTAQLTTTGGVVFSVQTNTGSNNGLVLGTVAKASSSSGGQGSINIFSNDASNQLQASISLITDATAANRRLQIQAIEQGVAFRNITLSESGGNVLIGTTIDIISGSKASISSSNGVNTGGLSFVNTGASTKKWQIGPDGNGNFVVFNDAAAGTYTTYGGTSWTSSSDERLKENLVPITDALNKINTLRSVTGNFIADETKKSRSFLIAQDVQKVLPEAVDDYNPESLGLQYSDIIPLLVAGIKELYEKFDAYVASNP